MKLVQAWIEIHKEDLLADWKLAVAGESVFKIDPLKYKGPDGSYSRSNSYS